MPCIGFHKQLLRRERERKFTELIGSLSNLPSGDVDAKFAILEELIVLLKEQIEELQWEIQKSA